MPKKFIDKKNSIRFHLEHGKNSFLVDEDVPRGVSKPKETAEEKAARIEEQKKYGIFFTDDTNYLEFLKERSDNFVRWPEHVVDEIEQKNRGSEILDVDVAMKEDFDFSDPENELEDNFLELAHGIEMSSHQEQWTSEETASCSYTQSLRPIEITENFKKKGETQKMDRDEESIALTKELAKRMNIFETEHIEEIKNELQLDSQSIRDSYPAINNKSRTEEIKPRNSLVQGVDSQIINSKLSSLSLKDRHEPLQEKKGRKKTFKKIMNEERRVNEFGFAAELERRHKTSRGNKGCVKSVCRAWQ